ncbi:hypothetical protein SH2C18_03950 [Clostridium sediminicola]|uniref:hypothetical protein n=1 Tax=Clostridium sediminicola TaxID=3114879 RepID=UPI0031F1F539
MLNLKSSSDKKDKSEVLIENEEVLEKGKEESTQEQDELSDWDDYDYLGDYPYPRWG